MAKAKISWWELAAFAAPAAPLSAMTLPSVIFLPPHFATDLGIPLSIVSALFIGVRVLDIVVDPGIGNFQDRTKTPLGRRKFWLLAGCPFIMLAVWWSYVGLAPRGPYWIDAAALVFLFFMYALMAVAHMAWSGELIPTYHGRTHVLGATQIATQIGPALMLVIAGYVALAKGSNLLAVYAMAWTIMALMPITVLAAVLFVPDAPHPPQPHLSIAQALGALARNRLARRVLLPDFLIGVSQGISGGLFLFYFQFVLGFTHASQTLLAVYFISGLAGVPIWWLIARRLAKHRTLQITLCYTVVTTMLLPLLPPGNVEIAAPFMVLAGLPLGGATMLTRSLMADVVDDDEVNTGARRSGIYFGILLTTTKVGVAIGPLTYIALDLSGFHPSESAHNTAQALTTLTSLFVGGPMLLCALAAFSLRRYALDE
jgi:Na+/melibiose symporter-like transporter